MNNEIKLDKKATDYLKDKLGSGGGGGGSTKIYKNVIDIIALFKVGETQYSQYSSMFLGRITIFSTKNTNTEIGETNVQEFNDFLNFIAGDDENCIYPICSYEGDIHSIKFNVEDSCILEQYYAIHYDTENSRFLSGNMSISFSFNEGVFEGTQSFTCDNDEELSFDRQIDAFNITITSYEM